MPRPVSTTVLLSRFDDLMAKGLRAAVESDPSLMVVAADVEQPRLGVVLGAHAPDVAIIDGDALGGPAEARNLIDSHPATRLVLLANDPSRIECTQLLAVGVSACLARGTQSRDVLSAIHLASRGLQVTPRTLADPVAGAIPGGELLTRREAQILPLLQQDRSNAQIALALQVGVETVRTHARNIYRKLGVSSRRELSAPPAREVPEPAARPQPPRRRPRSARLRGGHGLGRR